MKRSIGILNKQKTATQEMAAVNQTAAESIAKEKNALERLLGIAKNERVSKDERLKAIKAINSISPEYLKNITLDTLNTDKAKKAIEADGFDINEADDPEAGEAAPYGSGYSKVNEAIDIHNDESAMKALEDIAVNMTKWKGSEGAHYTDLLEKVIDFLKYGNHRTN
jgi:hypothetical protein